MIYIDVTWHHTDPAYPVRLVSELDDDGWERRKMEFYSDGRVGWASESMAMLGTELGLQPVPSLHEINKDREFTAMSINREVFESLWQAKRSKLDHIS